MTALAPGLARDLRIRFPPRYCLAQAGRPTRIDGGAGATPPAARLRRLATRPPPIALTISDIRQIEFRDRDMRFRDTNMRYIQRPALVSAIRGSWRIKVRGAATEIRVNSGFAETVPTAARVNARYADPRRRGSERLREGHTIHQRRATRSRQAGARWSPRSSSASGSSRNRPGFGHASRRHRDGGRRRRFKYGGPRPPASWTSPANQRTAPE